MKRSFFAVAAVIFFSSLRAQSKDDSLVKALDEAVITANKYPNKTSLTGKVVTIITRDQLEKSGGKDLSQLISEQAGIFISGANSNAGKDKNIFLRGAVAEYTLITIDGIPVYDPSGVGGNFDIRNLSVNNVERIEILKGSQSTLYGSDAIAGVINIITRKAAIKALEGNGKLSYGTHNTIRGNAGLSGRSGKLDYHATYTIFNTDGINEAVNRGGVEGDIDKYSQHTGQIGLGFRPNEKTYFQPFLRYGKSRGDIDQGAFTDELDYTYDQGSWQAGIRNEFLFEKSKLNLIYNYNAIDRLYIDDSVKSRNGFDTYSRGEYKGSEHFLDAYIHSPLTERLKLTAGLDLRNSRSDQEYLSISAFGPYLSKNSNDSLNQSQGSIYSTLEWAHPSGFNLEIGSRLNIHSEYGTHLVFNINPSWLINRQVKIFTNISSGYRTPSLYQLFSEFGNRSLKPESAMSYEAGVQYYSEDEKFTGRVVGFKRKVKEVMFFYTNPSTFRSQYINQDEQDDHGFELEGSYAICKSTMLKGFYTYTKGELNTRFNGRDTTYNNLLRRPESSFGFNISSQVTPRLFASTNINYTGKRKDAYFDNTSFTTVHTTLKSYVLWDIYTEYGILENKLKIFANLRNITNADYEEISGFNTLLFNGYGGIRFTF